MLQKIYLDHSATTPVDEKVLESMTPYFTEKFGNASSMHGFGQDAIGGVDKAREQVAKFLNCNLGEIIFTSGATEADNLAIKGVIRAVHKRLDVKPHIIISLLEHEAILQPCAELERDGVAEVTYVKPQANGVIDAEDVKKAIRENTVLVSIMYVNSEVGSIQPIGKIGKIIAEINEQKLIEWKKEKKPNQGKPPIRIYFHTDAVQAVNFLTCNVKRLHVDLFSLSGHKIYGPKGVGLLYKNKEVPLIAQQVGGHHENNFRSGTLNVPSIVGLGQAIENLTEETGVQNNEKISKLRDLLVEGVMKNIKEVILNTDRENAVPSHAHFSFLGVEGESILIGLDLEGVAVSTGSACASGSLKPSHVLLAMGIKKEIAHNSIRFTLGKFTTREEILRVIEILPPVIERLRRMAPKL